MSAWIVGNNNPGCLPDTPPSVHKKRENALIVLRSDMDQFASDVDQFLEEQDLNAATEALVGAMFAEADGSIPAEGGVTLRLEDENGWSRIFFMEESREDWYELPKPWEIHDDEPLDARQALDYWCSNQEMDTHELELLMSETSGDLSAQGNLLALATAATYYGINLDRFPLPVRI